jgi:hypothetical protein
MAFGRVIELTIGEGSVGTLISDLDIEFDLTRTNTKAYNAARFTIYNAKQQTRNEILSEGKNVVLKAGYADEGNLGIIFTGTITESISKKRGPDYVTTIMAMDIAANRQQLTYSTVSLSYTNNTLLSTILLDISGQIGIPIAGTENVTIVMNNGFTFAGTLTNLIKRIEKILKADGLIFFFDNNEMVIFRPGTQDNRFGSALITPTSGLIGEIQVMNDASQQNPTATDGDQSAPDEKKRIKFQCMINPKLRPNSVVILKSSALNGVFLIDKIRFFGGIKSSNFRCDIEASE